MAKAGDREWLSDSLQGTKHQRLEVRNRFHRRSGSGFRLLRTALEPGEDETAEGDDEGRDPVLEVMVAGARFVSGEEGGQRARRLNPVNDRDDEEEDPEDYGRDDQVSAL